ncbi:hypothetical protein AOLI_G00110500 [Acnodon oligacanthus]
MNSLGFFRPALSKDVCSKYIFHILSRGTSTLLYKMSEHHNQNTRKTFYSSKYTPAFTVITYKYFRPKPVLKGTVQKKGCVKNNNRPLEVRTVKFALRCCLEAGTGKVPLHLYTSAELVLERGWSYYFSEVRVYGAPRWRGGFLIRRGHELIYLGHEYT